MDGWAESRATWLLTSADGALLSAVAARDAAWVAALAALTLAALTLAALAALTLAPSRTHPRTHKHAREPP